MGGGNDANGLHAETKRRAVDAWDEKPTGTTQHWCRGARMDCHDGDALRRPCRSRTRMRIVDVDARSMGGNWRKFRLVTDSNRILDRKSWWNSNWDARRTIVGWKFVTDPCN